MGSIKSDSTAPQIPVADADLPKLDKLKYLKSQAQFKVVALGSVHEVVEEFVETEYYKNLESIDKQHLTTGSGFIQVAADTGDYGARSMFIRDQWIFDLSVPRPGKKKENPDY